MFGINRLSSLTILAVTAGAVTASTATATPSSHDGSMRLRHLPRAGGVALSLDAPAAHKRATLARFPHNGIALVRASDGRLSLLANGRHVIARTRRGSAVRVRISLDVAGSRITARVRGRTVHLARRLKPETSVAVAAAVRHVRLTPLGSARAAVRPVTGASGATPQPKPAPRVPATPAAPPAPQPRSTTPTAATTTTTLLSTPPSYGTLFAADSIWNTPLTAAAPLDPSSARLVQTLRNTVAQNLAAGTGPGITHKYSSTMYVVPADQPTVRVQLDSGSWGATLQQALLAVPIPPGATTAPGNDQNMTIWQPSTDRMWEFFRASQQADGWHASWGGAMASVSHFSGYFTSDAWPGLSGPHWGASASSLAMMGGNITLDELKAGVIPHALAMNIPWALPKVYASPAQRTDGRSTDPNAIPEGAHFRLDPNLDLSKLNLPPVTRMIAQAAQRYGLFVRDQTGGAITLLAQNTNNYPTDPYLGPTGLFGGKTSIQIMQAFPWDRLQLLKMDLHTQK